MVTLFPQLLDEGSPPGQTAQFAPPSPAGFHLPINVGGENQGSPRFGFPGRSLAPANKGEKNDPKGKNCRTQNAEGKAGRRKIKIDLYLAYERFLY